MFCLHLSLPSASFSSGFDMILDCLAKLNVQNEKRLYRVAELDSVIQKANKTIENLKVKVESRSESDSSPNDNHPIVVPPIPSEHDKLLQTVVERVEKTEGNINSHF